MNDIKEILGTGSTDNKVNRLAQHVADMPTGGDNSIVMNWAGSIAMSSGKGELSSMTPQPEAAASLFNGDGLNIMGRLNPFMAGIAAHNWDPVNVKYSGIYQFDLNGQPTISGAGNEVVTHAEIELSIETYAGDVMATASIVVPAVNNGGAIILLQNLWSFKVNIRGRHVMADNSGMYQTCVTVRPKTASNTSVPLTGAISNLDIYGSLILKHEQVEVTK
ncbi:hypothetical protein [Vibrio nigripulchritudo]|uniref:hypothetical protein n=1 Tax=Vibrio nigripulchritudo TaxID=28173 RepID=UPI0024932103|nr:hypothetical protein [Vibrio nigripulchritudo]BDU42899.1 hypothetical protein TUMSATVNIG3_16970 [Vibrio nigripulchritudo]